MTRGFGELGFGKMGHNPKRYRMSRVNGITQFLPATHTTILTLLRQHSPDGTAQMRQYTSDIAYYSIYRPQKDERLSWPSWLTN